MRTHNLSQHVHRIGFHFPSAVVATVCMDLGLSLTATGNVVPIHGVGGYTRHQDPDKSQTSQIAINTEARDVLKDLFPNIPDNDLNQIIKTSFQMVRWHTCEMGEKPAGANIGLGPAQSWYSTRIASGTPCTVGSSGTHSPCLYGLRSSFEGDLFSRSQKCS